MKEQQLKARNVKLWITFFKSALKSERSNSGSASRCRKEAKLKTGESRAADSGETVAGRGGKLFFAFLFQIRKKQTANFYFSCFSSVS